MGDGLTPILVTGSTGYLGSRILAILRMSQMPSIGVSRSASADFMCDLLSHSSVKELRDRYPDSCVIHCSAVVPKSLADYQDTLKARQSLKMVENLLHVGFPRIVFTSSMTVYPDWISHAREEDASGESSAYAASKFVAEQTIMSQRHICATVLRIPGLFGRPRQSGVLFNTAYAFATGNKPFLDKVLPYWAALHVDDAAEICVRAAIQNTDESTIMNVGYPERMSIADAVQRIAAYYDISVPVDNSKSFSFDLTKLHETLGPVANSFPFRLKELVNWVNEMAEERC